MTASGRFSRCLGEAFDQAPHPQLIPRRDQGHNNKHEVVEFDPIKASIGHLRLDPGKR
jgi:hypothetical protein